MGACSLVVLPASKQSLSYLTAQACQLLFLCCLLCRQANKGVKPLKPQTSSTPQPLQQLLLLLLVAAAAASRHAHQRRQGAAVGKGVAAVCAAIVQGWLAVGCCGRLC